MDGVTLAMLTPPIGSKAIS